MKSVKSVKMRINTGILQLLLRRKLLFHPGIKRYNSSSATNKTIAITQQLYMNDSSSPGSAFFLPHGTRILNKLINFMKAQQVKYGYEEVMTPLIFKKDLWEKSGHWENYKEDMFGVVSMGEIDKFKETAENDEIYGLKPMNCPSHCIMYSRFPKTYNELPVRYSDFAPLHRNEASGALTGLTRLRNFHQDDAHIFCTPSQISEEIASVLKMLKEVYNVFGLNDYKLLLSTRPDHFIGDIETWNNAENSLKNVLNQSTKDWKINEGDGAFYGPKIDVVVTDHTKKEHQIGTIQLDFNLPRRFDLQYHASINTTTSTNAKIEGDSTSSKQKSLSNSQFERPVMIHRAIFGSLERFLAILIDRYDGNWPFWLSPRQAIIIPVSKSHIPYAQQLAKKLTIGREITNEDSAAPLTSFSFHIDVNSKNDSIGSRIRSSRELKYNYLIMIGDEEIKNNTLSVRDMRSKEKPKQMHEEEVIDLFKSLEKSYK